MAGSIVILGSIPRTTGAGITVVHAGLTALAALAIIIIREAFRAAMAASCRQHPIPILACITASIIIIGRVLRTTFAGITVVHAGLTALVALAVINIRVAVRAALATGCRKLPIPILAFITASIIIIGKAFATAMAVARGEDIVSLTATAAVIRSHRRYNRKEKKDKTGRQQEPVCCQTRCTHSPTAV